MAAKRTDKRQQTEPLQIRMKELERAFLEDAARKTSEAAPAKVGLGPFIRWAALREAERVNGVSFADYEAKAEKRGKGGGR